MPGDSLLERLAERVQDDGDGEVRGDEGREVRIPIIYSVTSM